MKKSLTNGKKLTEIINQEHENVKYLPKIKLPTNLQAIPDALETVSGANLLIFVLPHQFLPKLLNTLQSKIDKEANGITLIKGLDFNEDGPILLSNLISKQLNIDVSVMMGANVASEVALEKFSETTVGYNKGKRRGFHYLERSIS